MATQTDVQQLIQSLTPSAVNNGNPNTVYNTARPNHSGWTPGTISPAASLGPLNLTPVDPRLTAWAPPTGTSPSIQGPILPTIPPMGPPTGGGTNPGTPAVPPPGLPPVEPPVTPPGGGGGGGVSPPYEGPQVSDLFDTLPPRTTESGPYGWGLPIYGPDGFTTGGGLGLSGGTSNGGSGFSWQQLVDVLSEPFLPGDLYQENTGKWSGTAALLAGADALLGPGAGWLAQQGGSMTGADWYTDYIRSVAENKMAGTQNDVQGATNKSVQKSIQEILERMSGGPQVGGTGGRSRPSSQAAGSTTVAEGAAAQDMVYYARLQQALNAARAQARKAMNPFYTSMW